MTLVKTCLFATLLLAAGIPMESCEAGPLMDWLRGNRANQYTAYSVGAPQAYSQMPGTCTTTCPKTCYRTVNRIVANCVPYTAFRTEWYRVPVTYYRPQTTTNPQTGCITTCMKPCRYYQMQARRVPYTTYQTVYRTVQQRIPYTVYETSYGTSCNSCTSCSAGPSVGTVASPGCSSCGVNSAPVSTPVMPSYGINTNGQYGVPVNPSPVNPAPANSVPQLNPSDIQPDTTLQRPANEPVQPENDPEIQPENTTNSSHPQPRLNIPVNPAPLVDTGNKTASLIREEWNYSPVSQVSYQAQGVAKIQPEKLETNRRPFVELGRSNSQPFQSAGWSSSKN